MVECRTARRMIIGRSVGLVLAEAAVRGLLFQACMLNKALPCIAPVTAADQSPETGEEEPDDHGDMARPLLRQQTLHEGR